MTVSDWGASFKFKSDFIMLFEKINNFIELIENNKVDFINASFGYYCDNLSLQPEPKYDIKIFNFTYSFKCGVFYYLEAPNGIGKSTLLRMFSSNLLSGNVFFGS